MGGTQKNPNYYYQSNNYQFYSYSQTNSSFNMRNIKLVPEQWIQIVQSKSQEELNVLLEQLKNKIKATNLNTNGYKIDQGAIRLKKIDWKLLKILNLDNCSFPQKVIDLITQSEWPKLEKLFIRSAQLSNEQMFTILKKQIQGLEVLQLSDNTKKHFMLSEIKEIPIVCGFSKLFFLNLDRNKIGANGAKLLSKLYMPQLVKMYNGFGQIQNQGMRHLVKANWPKLNVLSVDYSYIGLDGLEKMSSNNWKKLNFMWIGQKKMSMIGFTHVLGSNWRKEIQFSGYLSNCNDKIGQNLQRIVSQTFYKINQHDISEQDEGQGEEDDLEQDIKLE